MTRVHDDQAPLCPRTGTRDHAGNLPELIEKEETSVNQTIIGTEPFRTKKAARERIRGILDAHADDGGTITEEGEIQFVRALLQRHPSAKAKIGCGVAGFKVEMEPRRQGRTATRCFWVVRTDGTAEDFGYKKCLDGCTSKQNCLDAMRAAVARQLEEARNAAGGGAGLHAHHEGKTFLTIAEEWLGKRGLAWDTLPLKPAHDGLGREMADEGQREDWAEFHREHATLVAMPADEHLHLPKGQRCAAAKGEPGQ